ncbi:MAG: RNA-binding domain-containing protein [Candidatus Bathyarchaeota archaeon]|jgi:predicted RNA binding protein with dsRBD fold (UPF0201 family)
MNDIHVHVEVEVNPTEDLEKVKEAVENIFGAVTFKVKSRTWGQLLIATTKGTEGLTKLKNILARERIRAAARKVLRSGMDDNSVTFYLNKQVAYAGHISFSQKTAESPLGPINVQIRCSHPRELIEWLTPKPKKKPPSPSRRK